MSSRHDGSPVKGLMRRSRVAAAAMVVAFAATATGVAATAGPSSTVGVQPDGSVLVTNGQRLTPAGESAAFSGRPNAVAISPDGRIAAALTAAENQKWTPGFEPLVLVDMASGRVVQQVNPGDIQGSYTGIVFAPDGRRLYASMADGRIAVADIGSDDRITGAHIVELGDGTAYPGGLALTPDGSRLLIALSRQNALGVFDTATEKLTATIPVGVAPHSVVVSGETAYVSDEGGRPARSGDATADSAGTPVVVDPRTGAPTTGRVSVVDLRSGKETAEIPTGLHPTGLALSDRWLFVADTGSDTITVIDTCTERPAQTIDVRPYPGAGFGASPTDVTMLPGDRLAVALAGENALGFWDWAGGAPSACTSGTAQRPGGTAVRAQPQLEGYVPTAWFPGAVAYDPAAGALAVANIRGLGDLGPLATRPSPLTPRTGHYTHAYLGVVNVLPVPDAREVAADTATVAADGRWPQVPDHGGPSQGGREPGRLQSITHVFYVIKENNTYDSILGDDPRGNGRTDYAEYGGRLSPNQHALARRFPLLDNLFDSGENSALGHQWTDQAYGPDYLETAISNFRRSYPSNGGDPLAYTPGGFLWDDAVAHGVSTSLYGEYGTHFEGPSGAFGTWQSWYHDARVLEGQQSGPLDHPLGQFTAHSDQPTADKLLDREFPPFSTEIPDQYRLDIWKRDFDARLRDETLPRLSVIDLPNDHTGGYSLADPKPEAEVADNDLALGRLVQTITHSRIWRHSAIFVIEDDTQNDVDHVDGERTIGYVMSPYSPAGEIDTTYHTQVDMIRTIEALLGLPPMNQLDAAAAPMWDAFTGNLDPRAYDTLPAEVPLNEMNTNPHTPISGGDPQPAHDASAPTPASTVRRDQLRLAWTKWSQHAFGHPRWTADTADPQALNRLRWYDAHGFRSPYPGDKAVMAPPSTSGADHG